MAKQDLIPRTDGAFLTWHDYFGLQLAATGGSWMNSRIAVAWSGRCPTVGELSCDWPDYVPRLYLAAGELAGVKTPARWDKPPK